MRTTEVVPGTIRSTVPARLDRLGWSPFHTRMVAGLGGGVDPRFDDSRRSSIIENVMKSSAANAAAHPTDRVG